MAQNTNKVTHKDYYGMLRTLVEESAVANADELIAFIDGRVELLDKKKSSKVSAEKVAQNEENNSAVLDVLMTSTDGMTVTEIQVVCPAFSNQKCTSILTKLVADNLATREVRKGKSYYKAVKGE